MKIRKYIANCFLLLIPLFVWNALLVSYLPENYSPKIFDAEIPNWVSSSENVLRFVVFVFPAFMIFSLQTRLQKIGFLIYIVGVLLYFLSWSVVILYPQANWSLSMIGFTAPAFTTIIWFTGIGLIGSKSFFRIRHVSLIYIVVSTLFVLIHTTHAYFVFNRIY